MGCRPFRRPQISFSIVIGFVGGWVCGIGGLGDWGTVGALVCEFVSLCFRALCVRVCVFCVFVDLWLCGFVGLYVCVCLCLFVCRVIVCDCV